MPRATPLLALSYRTCTCSASQPPFSFLSCQPTNRPNQPTDRPPPPQVQKTIGVSDYVRRDMALKNLIQPLAGE
jgi:hypothetical protein